MPKGLGEGDVTVGLRFLNPGIPGENCRAQQGRGALTHRPLLGSQASCRLAPAGAAVRHGRETWPRSHVLQTAQHSASRKEARGSECWELHRRAPRSAGQGVWARVVSKRCLSGRRHGHGWVRRWVRAPCSPKTPISMTAPRAVGDGNHDQLELLTHSVS